MYRWHESGCRRPDVSAATGLPTCSYCFAIPSLTEDVLPSPQLPQLEDRSRMNLTWPSIVAYRNSNPREEIREIPDTHKPKPSESLLPVLPSEDCVRLLRLKPGTAESPIHADYEIVRINQIPLTLYEALSYTSVNNPADSLEPCPVYLGSYWDTTYVSATCGDALRRLRRQKVERLLWVSSLCIDHKNPEEKNTQVHILREVYSRATKVLAYIGNESPEFSAAFSFLKEITTFQPGQDYPVVIEKDIRRSLQVLCTRPYFSHLWALQETLMARELELVCGSFSARWPKRPFGGSYPDLDIPSWLFKDAKWFPFTGRDLLKVLVDASLYDCSDPRDKVFALLGLMGEKYIRPEYKIPVEKVYVGITAYLLKNWQVFDVIALAGQNRTFDLPSWVPDWSQMLSLPSLDDFLRTKDDLNDPDDETLDCSTRIKFKGLSQGDFGIEIDSTTGAMQTRGFRLHKVSGATVQNRDYMHVRIPSGDMGSFIISIPHQNYEVYERDELFLLNGYNHPVILRENSSMGSYTMVSACTVSIGCPESKLLLPWYRRMRRLLIPSSDSLTVSALTLEEDSSLQQLYSRLDSTELPNVSTTRARALSFLMLTQTGIQSIEKRLRVDWDKWNQELGWMFRDQSAIWQYLLETTQLSTDERCGEEHMDNMRGPDRYGVAKQSPSSYTWDLTRFCWAFLQPTDIQSASRLQWSPMVDHLRSHRSEIQQWAQVTEQLLRVFEYSSAALGDDWKAFPGVQLPQSWASNFERFQAVPRSTSDPHDGTQQQQRPHLPEDCLWSITEFERHLRAREEIWKLRSADERRGGEDNIEAHALLNHLGMDLYSEQDIRIE
ncbi:heterokaryon incompatibility protein-domain-containing protein [Aspergillus granulosus]|uniref:Heterokaryon incompatibility protein-domain-containing protein n=1 Tax=Aspergillus granulosus TaxID=176169 RepID=A0ABR4HPE5_9EURO